MNDFESLLILRKKSLIPYYGFSQCAISLLFLKYIKNKEYATQFNNALEENLLSISTVRDLLNKVEEEYDLKMNILENALFDINSNISNQYIIDYLKSEPIEYTGCEKEDLIYNILSYADKDASRTNIYTTNKSLIKLIEKILDVKENESFMNTFSGFNTASIKINASEYLGYELSESIYATSIMIMIFLNKKNIHISNEDIYLCDEFKKVDKILTDGPWGIFDDKIKYFERSKASNKMEYHNIDITINSLKDNGKAVIAVPNKLLTNDTYKVLRENLVKEKLLEAVISLPLLSTVTSVNPYLLVISKKDNKEVSFVEANNKEFYVQNRRINNLTNEGINKILIGLENEANYSKKVNINDLLNQKDMSLLVSNYVKEDDNKEYSKKEEIEEKLNDLYKKFNHLIKG